MVIHVSLSHFQVSYFITDDTPLIIYFVMFKNWSFQLHFLRDFVSFDVLHFFNGVPRECWSKYKTRQKLETNNFFLKH